MEIKKGDVNTEKHVPFVEEIKDGYRVTVGKPALHPMIDKHLIEYVELYVDDNLVGKHEFKAGDTPVCEFKTTKGTKVVAREFCNIHGLWEN